MVILLVMYCVVIGVVDVGDISCCFDYVICVDVGGVVTIFMMGMQFLRFVVRYVMLLVLLMAFALLH